MSRCCARPYKGNRSRIYPALLRWETRQRFFGSSTSHTQRVIKPPRGHEPVLVSCRIRALLDTCGLPAATTVELVAVYSAVEACPGHDCPSRLTPEHGPDHASDRHCLTTFPKQTGCRLQCLDKYSHRSMECFHLKSWQCWARAKMFPNRAQNQDR
jgi:hypothetical protein